MTILRTNNTHQGLTQLIQLEKQQKSLTVLHCDPYKYRRGLRSPLKFYNVLRTIMRIILNNFLAFYPQIALTQKHCCNLFEFLKLASALRPLKLLHAV